IKPRGLHPCDLLMVRGVTPAHKGLAPSRLINYISVVKRCPCWAHTKAMTIIASKNWLRRIAKPLATIEKIKKILINT
ncbi:MAG TPA: hypothetical protein VKN36_02920, partial [Eudoraea sp.]|nr:hypothetical protein [Eudoraea sp.]